jgi:hypothetical protein
VWESGAATLVSLQLWYTDYMADPLSISTFVKSLAALLNRSGRFLWSLAVACAAAAIVLFLAAHFGLAHAQQWWDQYGLLLLLGAVVAAVLAVFQTRAERLNRGIALIADEQHSFWTHAKQPDGTMFTTFALRFHATNMNPEGLVHLSRIRMQWPWFSRERIVDAHVMTQHPTQNEYGSDFGIQPRKRRACSAYIVVRGVIGGADRRKPMRVTVGIQDHAGRWHKLVYPPLRNPEVR